MPEASNIIATVPPVVNDNKVIASAPEGIRVNLKANFPGSNDQL